MLIIDECPSMQEFIWKLIKGILFFSNKKTPTSQVDRWAFFKAIFLVNRYALSFLLNNTIPARPDPKSKKEAGSGTAVGISFTINPENVEP